MLTDPQVQRIPMTREEFYRQAELRESGLVDWEEGFGLRLPPAHSRHGWFIVRLADVVHRHLRAVDGGRVLVEVFLDLPDRTYGVDLAVLRPENLHRHQDGRLHGPPDLVVEVLSDSSAERDRTEKFEVYRRHGVAWYWIGDPRAGTLEEYRLTPEGYLRTESGNRTHAFRPQALPGLEISLEDLLE